VLPDVYSGTFSYRAPDISTNGVRLVAERRLASDVTATLDYAYGGVLDAAPNLNWQQLQSGLRTVRRHAVSAKISGTVPMTKTRWISSYKWTSGEALLPVDMFNNSPGQSEPFWSIFVRQPIPGAAALGRMEALLEVRNLLAQGYLPVVSTDGRTLYLVQSARCIRGGVAFSF
jgi:hypothetical protein